MRGSTKPLPAETGDVAITEESRSKTASKDIKGGVLPSPPSSGFSGNRSSSLSAGVVLAMSARAAVAVC